MVLRYALNICIHKVKKKKSPENKTRFSHLSPEDQKPLLAFSEVDIKFNSVSKT